MKKSILPFLLLLLTGAGLSAQNPSRVTIRGQVTDTLGAEIPFATVMLLNPKDTTLVNFSRSDDKGVFAFKNVRNAPYLFKISYIGYIPHTQYLDASAAETNDLGNVKIKPITHELMEVVIKTAKAPLYIRGDTIEYDATTFKVPPGSTVEDLLRRLPGIEVDADGNIKAQGKDVKRLYVDGKTFFGDDPKSATKNLGAETISKVQVYDEKSDQAKLTGLEDGKKEKAMNLELKEEFKKGAFGKITGAIGTEERWASRGNYNRFDDKQQLSFIGYANNINETGVNWEDYGEFKGQNAFSDHDNGDFGFSNGGNRFYYFGDNDSPVNNFDGRGFTKNFGAGTNYNFDNQKSKFNFSYFYNQTDLTLDQYALRETFLSDNSFTNTDTSAKTEFRGNHSINTRLEHEIDSNDVLIFKANGRIGNLNGQQQQSQFFSEDDGTPINNLRIDNDNDQDSWRASATAIYRHRFHKKGRSAALSAGYNDSRTDGAENLFSFNEFFQASNHNEQVRQRNLSDNRTRQWKSSLLFTEPLRKYWFTETFYNFSQANNTVNRQVLDPKVNNERIDGLSNFYDYNVLYNRLGSAIHYSKDGLNIGVGVAAQQLNLKGEYSIDRNMPPLVPPLSRTFTNWVPNVDFGWQLPNNMHLNFEYSYSVSEPRLNDLQPVPNVSNPAFRTEGNPNLTPERSHSFSGNFNYWNAASFSNIGFGFWSNFYDNQIVYNQTSEVVDSFGIVTVSRPENLSGGHQANGYLWSNFPIIKTKLTLNLNGNFDFGKSPIFINGERSETTNNGFSAWMGLTLTPDPKLLFSLSGNLRFNDIRYSIQPELDQKIWSRTASASLKWQVLNKTFLESNFNYSIYENDRFDFSQEIPIWNASVRRLIGPSNRIEVRLAAFDLLNKRVSITQNGTRNYVTRNIAETLARYYMLSLSYNLRGYENSIKKGGWW